MVILAGVREKVAMETTGHKTRSVLDRYHIVDTQNVSNAMQQWEAVASQNLLSQRRGSKLGKGGSFAVPPLSHQHRILPSEAHRSSMSRSVHSRASDCRNNLTN